MWTDVKGDRSYFVKRNKITEENTICIQSFKGCNFEVLLVPSVKFQSSYH